MIIRGGKRIGIRRHIGNGVLTPIPWKDPYICLLRMVAIGGMKLITEEERENDPVTPDTDTIEYSCPKEGEIRKIFDPESHNGDDDEGLDSDGEEGPQQSHWDTFHIEESFELATENGK